MKGSKVPVYFVALHTKSKYIAGGEKEWTSSLPEMQLKFIKKSVANRRRIASEWLIYYLKLFYKITIF